MVFRLVFLSLASGALYALLGVWSKQASTDRIFSHWYQPASFEQSIEFFAVWVALCALYAMAVRILSRRGGTASYGFVFVTSLAFRLALFLGDGFDHSEPRAFLHGVGPLQAIAENERIIATLADLGSLALAPSLLRAAGLPLGAALVHGWNPLVIKEVAGSGRVEAVALFLWMLSIRLAQTGRFRGVMAIVYGASLNGPLLLLASLGPMSRMLRLLSAVAIAIAILGWTLAFPDANWAERFGWPPTSFLGGSITPSVVALAGLLVTRNELVPMVFVFAVWLGSMIIRVARWTGDKGTLPHELLVVVGGWIFVAPQVLPWAFLVVAYLAPYTRNRGWLVFTITAPLTYLALGEGAWSFWLGFAQYFVAYATLIFFWLGSPPSRAAAG